MTKPYTVNTSHRIRIYEYLIAVNRYRLLRPITSVASDGRLAVCLTEHALCRWMVAERTSLSVFIEKKRRLSTHTHTQGPHCVRAVCIKASWLCCTAQRDVIHSFIHSFIIWIQSFAHSPHTDLVLLCVNVTPSASRWNVIADFCLVYFRQSRLSETVLCCIVYWSCAQS